MPCQGDDFPEGGLLLPGPLGGDEPVGRKVEEFPGEEIEKIDLSFGQKRPQALQFYFVAIGGPARLELPHHHTPGLTPGATVEGDEVGQVGVKGDSYCPG